MKQKLIRHTAFGAILGMAMWTGFTIFAAYLRGEARLPAVSGHLVLVYGSELNAVAAQCVGATLCGILWSNAALIFRETDWNLLAQTGAHMAVCMIPALLIAKIMQFMPSGIDGLLQYIRLFGAVYGINWAAQYLRLRRGVKQINSQLNILKES